MKRRFVRVQECCERLACKKSKFYENYIRTGRLKLYVTGAHSVAALDHELQALIDEIAAEGAIDYSKPQPLNRDYTKSARLPRAIMAPES
jgi:hypothetical protein